METEISSFWFVLSHGWFLTYGRTVCLPFVSPRIKTCNVCQKGGGGVRQMLPRTPTLDPCVRVYPRCGCILEGRERCSLVSHRNHNDC